MSRRLCPDPYPVPPYICRVCNRPCVEMAAYGGHWRHGSRCLAPMPYIGERCWRLEGHRGSHRSPDAVAYANSLHHRYYHERVLA